MGRKIVNSNSCAVMGVRKAEGHLWVSVRQLLMFEGLMPRASVSSFAIRQLSVMLFLNWSR